MDICITIFSATPLEDYYYKRFEVNLLGSSVSINNFYFFSLSTY